MAEFFSFYPLLSQFSYLSIDILEGLNFLSAYTSREVPGILQELLNTSRRCQAPDESTVYIRQGTGMSCQIVQCLMVFLAPE